MTPKKVKATEENVNKIENTKQTEHPSSQEIADNNIVDFSEWEKIDLRVAKVKKVKDIEGADKLYKLTLDVGSLGERIVCAGIKQHYKKDELKGKKLIYLSNLKPRLMKGIESQGMILAAINEDKSKIIFIAPEKDIKEGSKIE